MQVGRQVDVHVSDYPRTAGRPRRAQRPAAALLLEPQHADVVELGASVFAMSGVRSVLALSAIVIRHENGTR